MTESRKVLIRNNVIAVVGLFLVTLLVWGFGELRILIAGHPEHSWGSSLTSLYTPAIWFLLFGLIFLRYRSSFNSLSVLAVPVAAILFFWPAGIYALTIGMSEVTAHWGFHARALVAMLGEFSENFMIFIPDTPGDPMSGGKSGGYNFFSGGIAAGIYAAVYMYFGVAIKGFILQLFASRKKDSVPPLQTQDSQKQSSESLESLRKPLLINNAIAFVGHFAVTGLSLLIMLLVSYDFRSFYLDYFDWFLIFFAPAMVFFSAGLLLIVVLHIIFGSLLLKPLPRLNFLSTISILLYSFLIILIIPSVLNMVQSEPIDIMGVLWLAFYIIPSLILAFFMYLGVFVRAFVSGKLRKSEEEVRTNEASPHQESITTATGILEEPHD